MLSPLQSRALRSLSQKRSRICRLESLESRELLTANPKVTAVNLASTQWTETFVSHLESQGLGIGGISIPAGANQMKSLPWTGLNQVKITFDQNVHVSAGDLSVSGIKVTAYAFSDFSFDSGTYTATWTLAAPVVKDKILLSLDANGKSPVHNADGQALDGAWTNGVSSFPSGNGTGGDDFKFQVHILPGDADGNNTVNVIDYISARLKIGKNAGDSDYFYRYDTDGSGSITQGDLDLVYARFGSLLPSGSPAGTNNNAPTVLPLRYLGVGTNATDTVFSLGEIFADVEDPVANLTFSVVGNTNTSLFNSASISQDNLVLSFAHDIEGTSLITLRATDGGGLLVDMTFNVTVADTPVWPPFDVSPTIADFTLIPGPADTWTISGTVMDPDQDVEGMVVTFGGVLRDYGYTAIVQEDGTFEVTKVCDGLFGGTATARTFDDLGMISNLAVFYVTL
jgi:hypothetical protein